MKAVVHSPGGELAVADKPEPHPGPGEVVVRPLMVAASTTDVHAYVYGGPAGADPGTVLGSELVGVVEQIGEGTEGLSVGDRVSVDPRRYCGGCLMCRAGFYSLCERLGGGLGAGRIDGGWAELVSVPAYTCYPLPAGISDLEAALVPSVVAATHAVRSVGVGPGDNVGVFGLDEVGLATLQWVRPMTTGVVVAGDGVGRRRDLAAGLGAEINVDVSGEAAAAILEVVPEGLDVIYVSINEQLPSDDSLLVLAMEALRLQAPVVITRVVGNRAWAALGAKPYLPLQREATIQNAGGVAHEQPLLGGRPAGDWLVTLRAFERRRLDADRLDTVVVPFSELRTSSDAMDALGRVPTDTSKVLFAMNGLAT